MRILAWLLVLLSALAFVLAVISVLFSVRVLGITPEAFSRACGNLALLSIALHLLHAKQSD